MESFIACRDLIQQELRRRNEDQTIPSLCFLQRRVTIKLSISLLEAKPQTTDRYNKQIVGLSPDRRRTETKRYKKSKPPVNPYRSDATPESKPDVHHEKGTALETESPLKSDE
ncbi:Uncharacterized protein Rs2_44033 [Raphanus sativus]|nr:hypothetical protein Rs2_48337 [Raphanus sativus]KAJ4874135.1 Uncharacterized protein Rs2_44033 [Raphanus sativus]